MVSWNSSHIMKYKVAIKKNEVWVWSPALPFPQKECDRYVFFDNERCWVNIVFEWKTQVTGQYAHYDLTVYTKLNMHKTQIILEYTPNC